MAYLKRSIPLLIILLCFGTSKAIPVRDYRKNIEQAIEALNRATIREHEDLSTVQPRISESLNSVRTLLPLRLKVEWGTANYLVDNTWLHQLLGEFEKAAETDRAKILEQTKERLTAVNERLLEIENGSGHLTSDK